MYHPFSITQTIATAWSVLKKNFITLVVYSLASLFVNELMDFLSNFIFVDNGRLGEFIVIFIQMVVQAYIALSFYKLILILIDKEYYEFSFGDILPSFRTTFNFVVVALLYGVLIALFLFIDLLVEQYVSYISFIFKLIELVVLAYLSLKSIFCVCFIVDDDSRPFESLRQSFEITKDNIFKTVGIFLIILAIMIIVLIPVITLINIFGLDQEQYSFIFKLAFYCWFMLTFPFVQVIIMVTYRKLVYSHKDVDDDITETV